MLNVTKSTVWDLVLFAGASQNSQMLQSVLTQVSDHFNR